MPTRTEELTAAAHRLSAEGKTQQAIADELHVSRIRVRQLLASPAPAPASKWLQCLTEPPPESAPEADHLEWIADRLLTTALVLTDEAQTSPLRPQLQSMITAGIAIDKYVLLRAQRGDERSLTAVDQWLAATLAEAEATKQYDSPKETT